MIEMMLSITDDRLYCHLAVSHYLQYIRLTMSCLKQTQTLHALGYLVLTDSKL